MLINMNIFQIIKLQIQTKIKIKCKTHGIFEQTPKNHLKGQICPKCSKGYKYGQDDFIKKCESIHCNRFDYSKVDYKTNAINIIIVCKVHGDFEQLPLNHLKGDGCYRCSGFTRTTDDFIKIWRTFNTEKKPHKWVVWPHSESKGWLNKIEGKL